MAELYTPRRRSAELPSGQVRKGAGHPAYARMRRPVRRHRVPRPIPWRQHITHPVVHRVERVVRKVRAPVPINPYRGQLLKTSVRAGATAAAATPCSWPARVRRSAPGSALASASAPLVIQGVWPPSSTRMGTETDAHRSAAVGLPDMLSATTAPS